MYMEPMKSKIKEVFLPANKESFSGRSSMNVEEWEIRPGGMLVQKRSSDSNRNSVSVSTIKVRVKYGSSCHEICICSRASFGELKKMVAEQTGVHPQDQKLIYKKKERDSKAYLDVVRVKNGSKIVLIEDITSRERRCLEMLNSANKEKASKSLQQISLEVDKLGGKVKDLETTTFGCRKVAEIDVDNLIEILMNQLVALYGIVVEGELNLQKRMQERRVKKYIETLDKLKLQTSKVNSNGGKISFQQQQNSIGQMPIPTQKRPVQPKNMSEAAPMPMQKQPLWNSEPVVVTTKWETFD